MSKSLSHHLFLIALRAVPASFLSLLAALLTSCVPQSKPSEWGHFDERPSFRVSIQIVGADAGLSRICLFENSKGVFLELREFKPALYPVSNDSRYKNFKEEILRSETWKSASPEEIFLGAVNGLVEDILAVQSDDSAVLVTGAKIPTGWKTKLEAMAREARKLDSV